MFKNLFIILAFIAVSFFYNCRGDQQNKIIGTWKQIPFTNPETTPDTVLWQFYPADRLVIYRINAKGTDSLQLTYNISGYVLDVFPGDDDPTYSKDARDPRGQYWVDLLTNDQCKATKRKHPDNTTDAAFMRIELVKR